MQLRILRSITNAPQEFMQNELVQVWAVHHLQMIGEAARGSLRNRVRGCRQFPGRRSLVYGTYWSIIIFQSIQRRYGGSLKWTFRS